MCHLPRRGLGVVAQGHQDGAVAAPQQCQLAVLDAALAEPWPAWGHRDTAVLLCPTHSGVVAGGTQWTMQGTLGGCTQPHYLNHCTRGDLYTQKLWALRSQPQREAGIWLQDQAVACGEETSLLSKSSISIPAMGWITLPS